MKKHEISQLAAVKAGKKLKVCLVGATPAIIRRRSLRGIPLGIRALKYYTEGRLESEGLENRVSIELHNFYIAEQSIDRIVADILSVGAQIIGFSVFIWNYLEFMEVARRVKEAQPDTLVLFGGPQVSPIALETITQHGFIDVISVVTTPGELVFHNFIKAVIVGADISTVEGIIYRDGEGVHTTPPLTEALDYDMAASPYPKGSLVLDQNHHYTVVLEGSRGCPYQCGYCFYRRGTKLPFFPLERLLSEIDEVYSNPCVNHVVFADSDIFVQKDRAEKIIARVMQYNDKNITSEFELNIRNMTRPIVEALLKLPDYRFTLAVQTTNPTALEIIGRVFITAEEFIVKIEELKQWAPGVDFHVDVMLGLPGDTIDGFRDTLEACLSAKTPRIGVNYPIYLLPGTRWYEQMEAIGIIPGPSHPMSIMETTTFPKKDVEEALRLSLWMEILYYYFPHIKAFFDTIGDLYPSSRRIDILERWIAAISLRFDLFLNFGSLVDAATSGSIVRWSMQKGQALAMASTAQNGYHIYDAILTAEADAPAEIKRTMEFGRLVYSYLNTHGIEAIEFTAFEHLPKELTESFSSTEVLRTISLYKRA